MQKEFLTPAEITESFIGVGQKKAGLIPVHQFLLGILAGAFIAFASEGSNAAIHTVESVGLGKALAGALFATGLMLVLVAGGELFTGNCLMIIACAERKISLSSMLRGWVCVYAGNFIGSVLLAYLVLCSGQLDYSGGLLGGFTLKLAAYKTGLTFAKAFSMGILCNWLVCLAVWMAAAAGDIAGKLLAVFFPIWLFIASGFEHSIANMYYIPAGIMTKAIPLYVDQALKLGATPESIAFLDWGTFFLHNLVPVTLGNIVGGCLFVGLVYRFVYLGKKVRQQLR
ncbi:MAG: formate/nitrite transporter family protein [Synergistaceae bacterium]|jgi:formate/nitrite transporter|nr:formate/nitrite transporter family protein [Synergistaceae bacterium]